MRSSKGRISCPRLLGYIRTKSLMTSELYQGSACNLLFRGVIDECYAYAHCVEHDKASLYLYSPVAFVA